MFSYGDLGWPKDEDPRFETEEDAIRAAQKVSSEQITDSALGIWDDETGELLHIVWEGWLYSSR